MVDVLFERLDAARVLVMIGVHPRDTRVWLLLEVARPHNWILGYGVSPLGVHLNLCSSDGAGRVHVRCVICAKAAACGVSFDAL